MDKIQTGRTGRKKIRSARRLPSRHTAPDQFLLPNPAAQRRASSLITTLLVLVVLSTICIAFMQSMSIERSVARSGANKTKAEFMADAAAERATRQLFGALSVRPYSAAYFSSPGSASGGIYLFLTSYVISGTNLSLQRIPVFSTTVTNAALFSNLALEIIPTNAITLSDRELDGSAANRSISATNDIAVDINQVIPGYSTGMVGVTDFSGNRRALPVNWMYERDSSGRIIGRFAYWVDDENSKLDLRTAGNANGPAQTHLRGSGTNLSDLSFAGFTNLGLTTQNIRNLVEFKNAGSPIPRPANSRFQYGPGVGISDQTVWNRIRPYLTSYSLSDDRSPDGFKKLNLNDLFQTTSNPTEIEEQVEVFLEAIDSNFPTFGSRYFSSRGASPASPNTDEEVIYLTKIAANVRDYIDTDNVATVIQQDGSAYTGNEADFIPYEGVIPDDIPAFGKESGPYLNEYALAIRVIAPDPHPTTVPQAVTITARFGHYVELFNPTGKTITFADLGPNPAVILANRTTWLERANNTPFRPTDIKIALPTSFTIAPGGYAVLTTDGPPFRDGQSDYFGSASNRYLIRGGTGPGTWEPINTGGKTLPTPSSQYEDYQINTASHSSNRYNIQCSPAENSYGGCRERILFVNDDGIIDFSLRIYSVTQNYFGSGPRNPLAFSTFVADGFTSSNNTFPESNAGSARLSRGDPRGNTEVSEIGPNTSSSWKSGNSPQYGNNIGSLQMTIGDQNYQWTISTTGTPLWRQSWVEYSAAMTGNHFVANTNMSSLGELGFIYDPARYDILGYRTFGRTLRVGQSDAPEVNRNANSTVATDTNWLGGLSSATPTSMAYLRSAFNLADVFTVNSNVSGQINLNGTVRGNPLIIAAALFDGFVFASTNTVGPSGALSGRAINTNAFTNAIATELTNNRPFIGEGDWSRLPLFSTNDPAMGIATGINMSGATVSDADREEAFRRSANLTTSRSLAFSIHSIGQAGSFRGNSFRVDSTVRRTQVIQFVPSYSTTNYPAPPSAWTIREPWKLNHN